MQIETEANHTKLKLLLLPTKKQFMRNLGGKLKLDATLELVDMEARIRAAIISPVKQTHFVCRCAASVDCGLSQ